MSVKERIVEFIKIQGLNVSEFEKRCNLSNGYISSMRKGFGTEKLNNVLREFPSLNREWLLYGEGEMLRSSVMSEVDGRCQAVSSAIVAPAFPFLRFTSTSNVEFLINTGDIISVTPSGEYTLLQLRHPIRIPFHEVQTDVVEVQGSFESISLRLAGMGCPDGDDADF